jgi:malonate decarboxylase alpha subunit
MMCIKGIYAKHGVKSLNHGIGFNTAAIELLLPTYGESLGLKGKICTNWVLNPHPTLIPAIESGWVKSICSFGGELGMEKYIKARPDVFATGKDGSLCSNRTLAQVAGLYGIDMFIGSTLQMDYYGNSSTVTAGRLSGFGGAPNMGHNPGGRRHSSEAWQSLITSDDPLAKGRKLVVQVVETFGQGVTPIFVEQLDAVDIAKKAGLPIAPVMVYGDDVSHVVTEQGIAYLYKAENLEERKNALKAIAGVTTFGRSSKKETTDALRKKGVVAYPSDIGIKVTDATRKLLAAKNIEQLVEWSDGLYEPPKEFKSF